MSAGLAAAFAAQAHLRPAAASSAAEQRRYCGRSTIHSCSSSRDSNDGSTGRRRAPCSQVGPDCLETPAARSEICYIYAFWPRLRVLCNHTQRLMALLCRRHCTGQGHSAISAAAGRVCDASALLPTRVGGWNPDRRQRCRQRHLPHSEGCPLAASSPCMNLPGLSTQWS